MQLDPTLILAGSPRPAPATTFNEAAQNQMQLRQMAQQGEAAKMQLEQAKLQQAEQLKLKDIARQATSIGPDGKPVFDSNVVPGLMGQAGMAGAIEADQKNREFQFKLENMKLDRAAKVRNMEAENRKRMAGILGSIVDEPSRQRAIAEIESDPALAGAYPLDLITKAYDPATSPELFEKMTGLYLTPEEQRARSTEKRNQFESDRTAALTSQGQQNTNMRAAEANAINLDQYITTMERNRDNEYEAASKPFREGIQMGQAKIRTFGGLLNENGTFKKPVKDEKAIDRSIADGFVLYGFANVKDAKGAVLTSDVTNSTAGRPLIESFKVAMDKLDQGGQLTPKERLAIVKVSEIYYQVQKSQNDILRQSIKDFVRAKGGDPNLVANTGYLPGEAPEGLGTEPSYAPARAPSKATPAPTQSSAPAPATSPAAKPATSPQPSKKPASAPADAKQAADGKWYSPDPNRPGKYILWE